MRFQNLSPTNIQVRPALIVASILAFSIFASFNLIPDAYANPCTANPCPVALSQQVNPGNNTISFREINSPDPPANSTVTASFDKSSYRLGQTATITINDFNSNLDINANDTITAQVENVGDIILDETGNDTGIFKGSFVVNGQNGVSYEPQPNTGRLQLTLDNVTGGGNIQFSDFIIDQDFLENNPLTPIVEPVHIDLGGIVLGSGGVVVKMSYADGLLGESYFENQDLLQMCYQPDSGGPWLLLTDTEGSSPGTHDFSSLTITSANPIFESALVTICGNFGTIPGGGSSGLVSSGFVLNFLAGVGRAGNTISPPSFGGGYGHYSDGLTFAQGTDTSTLDTSKYNQELPKQVMTSGEPVSMTFKTFESYNPTAMVHMGLYIIPRGQDMITSNSIGSIVWEKGKPTEVNDPNHILSDTAASSDSDGKFQYTQFSFTPQKSYDQMSFLVRAWNDHKLSTDIRVHDDIAKSPVLNTLPAGVVKYDNFDNLQAALEKDKFYKSQILAHIHSTTDVFSSTAGGHLYWLYDTINHSVTLVIEDKNNNELYSFKGTLDPIIPDKKGDYGFMQFTVKQLNRADEQQEKQAMGIEEAKAMFVAIENGLMRSSNW